MCVNFWEIFLDDIIRCKNFYFRPKGGTKVHPYRGVHFGVGDAYNRVVEVQFMTIFREAVCILDHQLAFKKTIPFIDSSHKVWLEQFSITADVVEFETANQVEFKNQ